MAKCPKCKKALREHPTLIGFDVGFYRCDACKKNYSESSGPVLKQIEDFLLGRKVELEEVNEKGVRVAPR